MEIDMKYKVLFVIGIILLFMLGIFLGIKANDFFGKEKEIVPPEQQEQKNVTIYEEGENTLPTSTKKYDIEVVYEDNYILCEETITSKNLVYDSTMEEVKKQEEAKQEKEGKVYRIKEETNDKIIYTRKLKQNCPNHFKVILEKENIVVYNVVDEEVKNVYRKIDISDRLIREEMKKELEKGIAVDSFEELNLLIEDLES